MLFLRIQMLAAMKEENTADGKDRNQWKIASYFSDFNQKLIDAYGDLELPVFLLFATIARAEEEDAGRTRGREGAEKTRIPEGAKKTGAPEEPEKAGERNAVKGAESLREILAYAAYPLDSLVKRNVCVEEDVRKALECICFPGRIEQLFSTEITVTGYNRGLEQYELRSVRLRTVTGGFGLNFERFGMDGYKVGDRIADLPQIRDKSAAKAEAKRLLPDRTLLAELDRIFYRKHPQKFYGIPVHYKLSVRSDAIAEDMVDLLVQCLYLKKRILSRRITKIYNIEVRRWDKEGLCQLFQCAQGSVVQIMLSGDAAAESEYASQYHQISEELAEQVKRNCGSILFIFVENTAHPGFAKQLLGKIDEEMDILEINEGAGSAGQALHYFQDLLQDSNMQQYYEGETVFQRGKYYSATEVRAEFHKWSKARLKDRIYRAYHQDLALRIEKETKQKGSAYEELQRMIGLYNVKEIASDIIAAYKIGKLRNQYYDSNERQTRHMMFTGNPGTAKTTVARLLAEILNENGILKTGTFIECGRGDLVGKYVGWTAGIVKEKFKQARGGILFIDEAYALVEERAGSYGDEAIAAIVQEMENKRGDVLVIFAGYPEKMEQFLARNEGLRSRIAFHVEFPDYSPEELLGILEKILKDQQYTMTEEARKKVKKIFAHVYTQEEYGNGRFVRNLFEQAVNRQAARISLLTDQEISRETLFRLEAEDFETNLVRKYEKKKIVRIGFAS